jgi:hypothetical protein
MPCHYNVRVGSRSWFYDNEGTHVDATVEAIYRHPDYGKEDAISEYTHNMQTTQLFSENL